MREHNPLITSYILPPFSQIKPEHVLPALQDALEKAQNILAKIEKIPDPSWETVLEPLADISELLHRSFGPVSHLHSVANSDALREAYNQALPLLVQFSLKLSQNKKLYQHFKNIRNTENWTHLSATQKRIIEHKVQAAELSGIGLNEDEQKKFNEIVSSLRNLETQFANNILDATKAFKLVIHDKKRLEGLPESFLELFAAKYVSLEKKEATADKGPWLLGLDSASFIPLMQYVKDRSLRHELYQAFIARASSKPFDNCDLIEKILDLRKKQAEMLGFKNFAEMSLTEKMAKHASSVYSLTDDLLNKSFPQAKKEFIELSEYAKKHGQAEALAHADVSFWAKRLEEEKFAFTDEEIKPYFSLDQVLDGLFKLCDQLFAIKVKPSSKKVDVWDPAVRFYDIFENDKHIASFFLDPFSRPENKREGAWMNDCLSRRKYLDGRIEMPVAYLVCNFTPPMEGKPSLLTYREVETLFHEFGHGLQHMLTRVDYEGASGIQGIEWDAVELPSQFMENFCYHKETVMGMAFHYQTKEPFPLEKYEKVYAAKNYRAASQMLRQLQFGLVDMRLHDHYIPFGKENFQDVYKAIYKKTSILPPLENDFFLCGFSHIFAGSYAAGYYSYKWAEVLSADAFAAFEEAGLNDPLKIKQTGERFRNTVLALGGSKDPMEVFKSFRGRAPTVDALLRHSGL